VSTVLLRVSLLLSAIAVVSFFSRGAQAQTADSNNEPEAAASPPVMLFAIGDSLGHGTMDATNNYWATANAFLSRVAYSLATVEPVYFRQPYYDFAENRIQPYVVPTNLSVDGADVFSIEGLVYGKRAGSAVDYSSSSLLADHSDPAQFADDYDKVLSPANLVTGQPMSQVDTAVWLVDQWAPYVGVDRAICFLWIGNNDSSTAALGRGGSNPTFLPLPLAQIAREIDPSLFWLLVFGVVNGDLSLSPYTAASISRNLTDVDDFTAQYDAVLTRLIAETASSGVDVDYVLLTLPYYSAVGYLFDSDDLEFYLRKVSPSYTIPASFARVRLPEEPLSGDRVSLLTFGFMYALLATGYSPSFVNGILDGGGVQKDGLVLSEAEQQTIRDRIDSFNAAIRSVASKHGDSVHVIDVGEFLNQAFLGEIQVPVNGRVLSRKWVRGGGLTFDGVHPNIVGQSLIADYVLYRLRTELGITAPLYDFSSIATQDPYWDKDGDGWAPGPPWTASGITELLHLFRDPNDSSASVGVQLPLDVWARISQVLLSQVTEVAAVRAQAEKMGIPVPR
jgi:hypothetical protein